MVQAAGDGGTVVQGQAGEVRPTRRGREGRN